MDTLIKETNIFYNVFCFLITENDKFIDKTYSELYWRNLYHTLALLHHVYVGVFAMGLNLDGCTAIEIKTLKTYRAGYLTGWNFMFQTIFLFASVVYDTLEWVDKHEGRIGRLLKYWRDIVFSAMVVPITLFVTSMFWSVYSIDRELVFPQVYDQIVPWWFNHCVHTNIVVVVAIETLLVARRRPVNERLETLLVAGVTVLYAIVYYSIYFFAHRWLYGVFGVMTWWQVCLFQTLIWASSYVFYRIQFPINRLIHGQESGSEDQEDKDSVDHGVRTLGRMNKGAQGDVVKSVDVEKVNTDADEKSVENGTVLTVNGVGVNVNDIVSKETESNGVVIENGIKANGQTNGFKVDDVKRRNSNSPIFTDRSWSKKYRSLRGQFEKTKL